MSFQFGIPSLALRPYIKQYWAIDNVLPKNAQHIQRIIATGLPEIVFYFDNRPQTNKRKLEGDALLNVQQNDFYDLVITDKLSMFSVTFQPQGLRCFFDIPLNELQNESVYLGFVNKRLAVHLEQQLAEAESFQQRASILEIYFMQLLSKRNPSIDYLRMSSTIELIKAAKANVSIDSLADDACLSRKQFERKFMANIGISPKQYLKIIRFQYMLHLRQSSTSTNLTALAHEAGYYDQSHFINESKDLTGYTPKKLFDSCDMVSDFFR